MRRSRIIVFITLTVLLYLAGTGVCGAIPQTDTKAKKKQKTVQAPPPPKRYKVEGGVMRQLNGVNGIIDSPRRPVYSAADSLAAKKMGVDMAGFDSIRTMQFKSVAMLPDSLAADSLGMSVIVYDSLKRVIKYIHVADSLISARKELNPDSLKKAVAGTMLFGEEAEKELSKRQKRRLEREERYADSTFVRYSKIFPDTLPISRMAAISFVVPGFSQLHNKQAWKIPILYGVVGASAYLWHKENKKYKPLKKEYDFLVARSASRSEIEPVQRKMIRHNTTRQLFMAATIGTYIYFIGDGVANYPGNTTSVKKATTLSTIFPGAGQIYNGSYWKVPIVIGGFATMAYIIDWNNRAYKRYDTALRLLMDGDPNTKNEFELRGKNVSADELSKYKASARRQRDLAIILTGALYLLNVIDAHVDAHLKDYDISDDLSMNIVPTVSNFASLSKGNSNTYSLSLQIKF